MEGLESLIQVDRTLEYDKPDPPTVFRIAWYAAARRPGVRLTEYSEAESQTFEGNATFFTKIEDSKGAVRVSVEGAQTVVGLTVWGEDQDKASTYVDEVLSLLQESLDKYKSLEAEAQERLRRALVAKTCTDRIVYLILNRSPVSDIYFQVAHAREMMIKAAEGQEVSPVAMSTAGWLAQIESLPRDQTMPANIATELAKKSIEWKSQVHDFIDGIF
jgi:hypothetical protein